MDGPQSDTGRAKMHDPDQSWPLSVKVVLEWQVDGYLVSRTAEINADAFFGRGGFGAPMEGAGLVRIIENLRKSGPPPVETAQPRDHGKKKR